MRRFSSHIPLNYKIVYIKHDGVPHIAMTELCVLEPDFLILVCLDKAGTAGRTKIKNSWQRMWLKSNKQQFHLILDNSNTRSKFHIYQLTHKKIAF